MSIADVTSQISDIRSRLALLAPPSANSAAGFASALSSATATTAASGTTLSGTGVTGSDVVNAALQYKGVPYVLGGESKSGIDCSGLVQAAFKDLGVAVPRLVHQQQTIGQPVASLKDAKPGDLIVLNGGDHIAIWMGNGQAIHAPYPGRTVSVQKAWFSDADITTIRRVVPATADATSGSASPLVGATTGISGAAASSATTGASASAATAGASSAAQARAAALVGMYGSSSSSSASSSSDPLASMLASYGATGSGSTAQQLLAARSALAGS